MKRREEVGGVRDEKGEEEERKTHVIVPRHVERAHRCVLEPRRREKERRREREEVLRHLVSLCLCKTRYLWMSTLSCPLCNVYVYDPVGPW